MQHVWNVLAKGRGEVERHPFFSWMNSETVPLTARFIFSPVMIDFIMSFADMNKWFLRYPNPSNELEFTINEHTDEDATHSRLFVENWDALKLGDTQDWSASKGLWWLFLAKDGAAVRRFGMDVLKVAVRFPDPLVRFSMMEAIEICGDVFFANTAPIAERLRSRESVDHIYYGQYHRDRETGHLQADEGCFVRATLSLEQRRDAEHAAELVFRNFLEVLDRLLDFSRSAVADHCGLQRRIEREYVSEISGPSELEVPATGYMGSLVYHRTHEEQLPLIASLERRVRRLEEHRLLDWIGSTSRSAVERLRAFTPLWGIDAAGYKDFNEIVLRYERPASLAERTINRWTDELASRSALFLQDWKALRLDAILGWRMADVISYYFLSEHTEVHRCNMAKVKKLAMKDSAPVVRWWLMFALERGFQTLFESTRPVAREAEAELGITLNYWGYRHAAIARGASAEVFPFLEQPMAGEDVSRVQEFIETIFDNFEDQFELSYDVASSGVFTQRLRSLPPPRISEIVRHHPTAERKDLLLVSSG